MRLYHLTTEDAVPQILAHGFRDTAGDSFLPEGVWLSDSSDLRHRAMRRRGNSAMLVVDVPDDVADRFLAAEFPGRWREYCVPAEIVNRLPVRPLVTNP